MLPLLLLLGGMMLAALAAQLLLEGSGYVLLVTPNGLMSLEMSFWTGLILLLALLLVSFFVLRVLGWLSHPLRGLHLRQQRYQAQAALKTTVRGLVDLAEGRWKRARKLLVKAAPKSGTPLINYLAAAQAAHYEGLEEEAEQLLKKAEQSTPDARLAIDFSQARIQLDQGHYEQALATLVRLYEQVPKHPLVLRQLRDTYLTLGDWKPLLALLPALRQAKVATSAELDQLEERAYLKRIEDLRHQWHTGAAGSCLQEEVRLFWQHLPKKWQEKEAIFSQWIGLLFDLQSWIQAEQLLSQRLKQHWSSEWIELYGRLPAEVEIKRRLLQAEKWLHDRPDDAALLHALGRISQQAGLWGKAREYYHASWSIQRSGAVALELARLLKALNEPELSQRYEREALGLLNQHLPRLPLP